MDFGIDTSARRRPIPARLLVASCLVAVVPVLTWGLHRQVGLPLSPGELIEIYQRTLPEGLRAYIWTARALLFDPVLLVVLVGVLAAERFIPVSRRQRTLSAGFAQDFFWYFGDALVWLAWIPLYAGVLRMVYDEYLAFLTLEAVGTWPAAVQIAASVLFIDFLRWCRHFLKHRWWLLWCFHAVHHSQRELNVFTDFRFHVGERMADLGLTFVLLYMFEFSVSEGVVLATVLFWYPKIYHGNLKTHFGFLRHVLVTPQFHRIHHSLEPSHQNKNLGTIFTIWDRLFGTMYDGYDEYPETGIDDDEFPVERRTDPLSLVRTWVAQCLYPFFQIARSFGPARTASSPVR